MPGIAQSSEPVVTPYQSRVYAALLQIPKGRVSTYALLARALSSSPRAIGGALRRNPFAPEVPCHRIVQTDMTMGGFKGEAHKAPSGINCRMKERILKSEGVLFDEKGKLLERERLWDDFHVE